MRTEVDRIGLAVGQNADSEAGYAWPTQERAVVEWYGAGDITVALGLLPHANEPLGYRREDAR